jgi:hypothetical protein
VSTVKERAGWRCGRRNEQFDNEVDGRRDQQCTLGEQQNGKQNEQRIPGIVHLRVIRCTHSVVPYKTIDLHLPV